MEKKKKESQVFPVEIFVEILNKTRPSFDGSLDHDLRKVFERDNFEYIKYLTEKSLTEFQKNREKARKMEKGQNIENEFHYEIVQSVRKPRNIITGYEQKQIVPVPILLEESYVIYVAVKANERRIYEVKKKIERVIKKRFENINVSVISPKYAPWLHKYLKQKKVHSYEEASLESSFDLLDYKEPGKAEATA